MQRNNSESVMVPLQIEEVKELMREALENIREEQNSKKRQKGIE